MIVTLDAKHRLTVPSGLMAVAPGDAFDVQFDPEEDAVIFRRLPGREDWLDGLSACPVPMEDLPQ